MKKGQFKKLKSLQNFKKRVEETYVLIHALDTQVISTRQLLDFTKARNSPDYKKFQKYLEVEDKQIEKLFELGFVGLFANFECFMFELLKELFRKYPNSFKSDKVIKFEDIKDFDSLQEVKEYFIDSIAIEKTYDFEVWIELLYNRFKIKVLKSEKDLKRFRMLNSLRNIILHSGSMTNSRFRKEMSQVLKTPVPIGEPFGLSRKKFFEVLHNQFLIVAKNIENT